MAVETSGAISSEIFSQMSRKLEEMQTSLNSKILDAFNAVIERKVLPSIKIAVKTQNSDKVQIWTFGQMDCIQVIPARFVLSMTFSQIDCIQKTSATWLRMFKIIFPG